VPARVVARGNDSFLAISLPSDNGNWRDHTPLVADHGKLVHLFLISDAGMSSFAHLHPARVISDKNSAAKLPPLNEGNYSVYADINHESGFTETLVSKISLTNTPHSNGAPDADDSIWSISRDLVVGSDIRRGLLLANGATLGAVAPLTAIAGREA